MESTQIYLGEYGSDKLSSAQDYSEKDVALLQSYAVVRAFFGDMILLKISG